MACLLSIHSCENKWQVFGERNWIAWEYSCWFKSLQCTLLFLIFRKENNEWLIMDQRKFHFIINRVFFCKFAYRLKTSRVARFSWENKIKNDANHSTRVVLVSAFFLLFRTMFHNQITPNVFKVKWLKCLFMYDHEMNKKVKENWIRSIAHKERANNKTTEYWEQKKYAKFISFFQN